jgi:hypothetical protein
VVVRNGDSVTSRLVPPESVLAQCYRTFVRLTRYLNLIVPCAEPTMLSSLDGREMTTSTRLTIRFYGDEVVLGQTADSVDPETELDADLLVGAVPPRYEVIPAVTSCVAPGLWIQFPVGRPAAI